MNSFKAVEKALSAEEKRHREVLEEGSQIIQETRFFDDLTNTTTGMRSKEYAHDYRYFPEPDLVPIEPPPEWIKSIKTALGELPEDRKNRLMEQFKLPAYEATLLTSQKVLANFFEECVKLYANAKVVANWLLGDLQAYLKANNLTIEKSGFAPAQLAELLALIDQGTISGKLAKTILVKVLETGKSVKDVIAESGLTQISDERELQKIIKEVITANPQQVEQFKAGKETVVMFFVGQVMKASKGRANPEMTKRLLLKELQG
jgi:aspartyl-tRNA(Asn)/glutamyl-tRNA(Gln) amidotransferase subunit B